MSTILSYLCVVYVRLTIYNCHFNRRVTFDTNLFRTPRLNLSFIQYRQLYSAFLNAIKVAKDPASRIAFIKFTRQFQAGKSAGHPQCSAGNIFHEIEIDAPINFHAITLDEQRLRYVDEICVRPELLEAELIDHRK